MTTRAEILEALEGEEDLILWDGMEDALVGIVERCGFTRCLVYDYRKMVDILVARDGMSEEEAVEYLDFNVVGAYVGEHTPFTFHALRFTTD